MKYLGTAYGLNITDDRIKIYYEQLIDLDYKNIRIVAQYHLRTEKRFPSISELRNEVVFVDVKKFN